MASPISLSILIPIIAAAVILLGVGIGVFTVMRGKRRREMRERWVKAAYSLWTGGEDCGTWQAQRAQTALSSWYGANNVGAFWGVIKDLKQGMTGNPAWDLVRALDLLRIATAAGYIDADQCWTEAAKIGATLQQRYRSWEELAQAFVAGMVAWNPKEQARAERNLPALRQEVWPSIPFSSALGDVD
jgi:hypothetical protein